jgi:hypothetical protein
MPVKLSIVFLGCNLKKYAWVEKFELKKAIEY